MASESGRVNIEDLLGTAAADALAADGRAAMLWSGTDASVLWMSEAAATLLGARGPGVPALPPATPALSRIRAFAREAQPGEVRREQLRFFTGSRFLTHEGESRLVPLETGAKGVLTLFGPAPTAASAPAPAEPTPSQTQSAETRTLAPAAPAAPQAEATVDIAGTTLEPAAPAAASPAAVSTSEPARPQRPTRPVRFVFQTDSEGTVTTLSPSFAHATGHPVSTYLGRTLADIVAEFSPATAARVAHMVARHETWSGVSVDWPLAAGDAVAPVELSAAPILGPDRTPTGLSGFGICRLDRLRERPAQPAIATKEAAEAEKAALTHPGDAAEAAHPAPIVSAPHTEPEGRPGAEPSPDGQVPDAASAAEATEDASSGPVAGDVDDAALDGSEATVDGEEAPQEPHAPQARPVQDNARQPDFGDQRIVPLPHLRAQVGASLAGSNVVSLKPTPDLPSPPAAPGLSMAERHAFREIAKALGARFEGAEPPAAPATGPAERPRPAEVPAPQPVAAPAAGHAAAQAAAAPDGFGDMLVERLPIGVLVFRGTEALYLNRPMLDLTGYADIADFRAQNGLDKLFQARPSVGLGPGEFDTVTILGRDGQALPVDAHLQTIDWHGTPATLVSFRRAIDAETGPRARSLELELKARRADLAEARAMLDTATDGVISLDDNGRILALNRSAEALFGYDQKELAGERLTLLLAPESHALALDYLDGLRANGVASVLNDGREVIGKERNGGRIPLFMTVGRVSETGKFAAVVRDLTAWKRAEAELTEAKRAAERASALKSDFLAKISHEIRTPMNAIIGFAEVMRDERLGPIGTDRYKEYLKDIHTSGEHVISLVNDLLDLSKIEAGRMDLTFGSVDLNAVVSSCLGIMQPQANRDRVIMRSQLSPKLPPVVADERSIRQIVLNLLSNASKFTEPGGQVIISTALTEAGEAVIRVRDTGIGMTESEVQAALEPFRQLSTTRHRGGTGLGLPLTKALVEANRAAFTIRSKSREGTLVEVTFPPTRVLAE